MYEEIKRIADEIRKRITIQPKIGLILGSGLGGLAEEMETDVVIPYEDIPGFPHSTVAGHAGRFVIGKLDGVPVIAMQGRFHYYEGHSMQKIVFPVRVMSALEVETLVVSNAAGGVNETFRPGELMVIRDHLNQMGAHPLIGPNEETFGVRFPDMSNAYDEELIQYAHGEANGLGLKLHEGVYCATTGPSYETPAEVRMFRKLGADAIGMSTVPEVIAAKHAGMRVLGISCISNAAAGIDGEPLSHDEVILTTARVRESFSQLMRRVVIRIGNEGGKRS